MSKLDLFIHLPVGMDPELRRDISEHLTRMSIQINRMSHDWTTVTTASVVAHDLVLADASATATLVVTIPKPVDWEDALLRIKKIDSSAGKIFIKSHGGETIDGATTKTIAAQYTTLQLFSDGDNWWIV